MWKKVVNNLPVISGNPLVSYLHLSFIVSQAFVAQIVYILNNMSVFTSLLERFEHVFSEYYHHWEDLRIFRRLKAKTIQFYLCGIKGLNPVHTFSIPLSALHHCLLSLSFIVPTHPIKALRSNYMTWSIDALRKINVWQKRSDRPSTWPALLLSAFFCFWLHRLGQMVSGISNIMSMASILSTLVT